MRARHCLPRRFGALAPVAGLLALVACGSGGSSTTASSTTTRPRRHASSTTSAATSESSSGSSTGAVAPPPTTPATGVAAPGAAVACGERATTIAAAVTSADLGTVPIASYTVTNCRVAASSQIWAAVDLTPNAGSGASPLVVMLERVGSIWDVHAYGSSGVGCDAPAPVPAELRTGC